MPINKIPDLAVAFIRRLLSRHLSNAVISGHQYAARHSQEQSMLHYADDGADFRSRPHRVHNFSAGAVEDVVAFISEVGSAAIFRLALLRMQTERGQFGLDD